MAKRWSPASRLSVGVAGTQAVKNTMVSDSRRIRTFIAVDIDSLLADRIAALQTALAKTKADVRWVERESWHITLKFLGPTLEEQIPQITDAIHRVAAECQPWPIELRGLGAFPSLRRPRVLWLGVRDEGRLAQAARALDDALAPLGFAPEERPFQPHLTIGRVRSLKGWEALEEQIKSLWEESWGEYRAQEIILYQSDLRPTGAVYTALWKTPLGKTKGEQK
ncbi:MAG: RNA 2',3'-cyclic phosphodiesterase [Candidatus Binatia bacterium]|nr:MAG: RNA 2',3'-cyclic phosphodiesterase [Candidatus Binatia bacterium]